MPDAGRAVNRKNICPRRRRSSSGAPRGGAGPGERTLVRPTAGQRTAPRL